VKISNVILVWHYMFTQDIYNEQHASTVLYTLVRKPQCTGVTFGGLHVGKVMWMYVVRHINA